MQRLFRRSPAWGLLGVVGGVWASSAVSASVTVCEAAAPSTTASAEDASEGGPHTRRLSRLDKVAAMSKRDAFKTRLYGNYENRLRLHSSPEKVFEYFASIEGEDDEWFMTSDDFVRAITPFNPAVNTLDDVRTRNTKHAYNARSFKSSPKDKNTFVADIKAAFSGDRAAALRIASSHDPDDASPAYVIDGPTRIEAIHKAGHTGPDYLKMMALYSLPVTLDDSSSSFAALVDQDGDGLLSFGEYMFFLTLLAIPSNQFVLAFRMLDSNDDGGIDRHEFQRIMTVMRSLHPQGRQVRDKNLLGENLGRVDTGGVLRQFFGVDGSKKLSPRAFANYVAGVQYAVREREFKLADIDNSGYLTPLEFAMFLVTYAPVSQQQDFIDRAFKVGERLKGGRVSKAEFFSLYDLLSHLSHLQVALDVVMGDGDCVTPEEFRRATRAVFRCSDVADHIHTGSGAAGVGVFDEPKTSSTSSSSSGGGSTAVERVDALSELQVEVLFEMFDADGDGHMSRSEFLDLMQRRASRGLDESRGFGLSAGKLAKHAWFCARSGV